MATILPTLSNAYHTKNWTYRDIASGHLSGNKVGRIFSSYKVKTGFFPWLSTTLDQASLYCKARDLGMFEKMPALRKPFIFGSVIVACINLREVRKRTKHTTNLIWNLTPKINALGLTAVAVCEFPKKPMKTATFFVSGAVSLFCRISFKETCALWSGSLWFARAHIAWTGSWTDRGLAAFKVVKTILFKVQI